jgi:hypothetical protein
MGASYSDGMVMGLKRIEYIQDRMMFFVVPQAEVDSIMAGERDAEVLAWDKAR